MGAPPQQVPAQKSSSRVRPMLETAKGLPKGGDVQPWDAVKEFSAPVKEQPVWKVLSGAKIAKAQGSWGYSMQYSTDVMALMGKKIEVTGYTLPLEMKEPYKHFILSKRTPTCAFCPPGEPNEIIEVMADRGITWSQEPVSVRGTIELTKDEKTGLFFKIMDGVVENK